MLKLNPRGWKDIEGYEYQVHRLGLVRNRAGLVMKDYVNNSGYSCIKLCLGNRKYKAFLVHRLVAAAFVKNRNPEVCNVVNHKDGNKGNNSYSNLEWCTNSENILHARRTGLNPYNMPTVGKKFGTTSQYHGVGFDHVRHKWYSGISHQGRIRYRRRFDTEEEAARHYNWIIEELSLLNRPKNVIKKCLTTRESTRKRKRVS